MRKLAFARPFRNFFAAAIVCSSVVWGCGGCFQPPAPDPKQIWDISPTNLVANCSNGFSAWNGHTVRITLAPNTYQIHNPTIHWHVSPNRPTAIEFHDIDTLPANTNARITIVGTCQGYVRDGINRGGGIDGCVFIRDCMITSRD